MSPSAERIRVPAATIVALWLLGAWATEADAAAEPTPRETVSLVFTRR